MELAIVENETRLERYEAAKRAIAAAVSVDEAKEWHDKAAAIKAYARQVNDRQMELDAAEIRIRAERRLGELLKKQKETVGMNKGANGSVVIGSERVPVKDETPTLADVGISKKLSSRSQAMAGIPESKFEETLSEHRENQKAVTQSTMDKLAKQGEDSKTEDERRREKSGRPEWMSVEDFRTGISAHGWVKAIVRENGKYDPSHIANDCLSDKYVPKAIHDTKKAIEWLEGFLEALEERNV